VLIRQFFRGCAKNDVTWIVSALLQTATSFRLIWSWY